MLKLAYRHGKSVAALAASGVLAFSTLGTAFADGPAQEGKGKQGIFGSVTAKGENSFTVMTKQGSTVDLAVRPDTQFQVPGKEGDSFADLAVGGRVAVLAEGEAGAQSARKVMLVPGKPQREHRALTVMEVKGSTVVAEDAEGNRIEVELDHQPSADIKGQLITFIGTKSGQTNRFKANAEVKIEQIVKRLEAQAKKLDTEARGEADAKIRATKEKHRAELRARLEANMQRHLDLFAEIIAKAPPQARASLEAALRATLQGYKAALEALGESKTDVEDRLHLRTLHGTVEAINLLTGLRQPDLTTPATGSGQAPSIASGQIGQTGEITVQSPADADVTLKLTTDTQIFVGEKPGKPSDISVGDRVTLGYNSETLVAAKVRVETEVKAQGRIKSVDRASEQLVVTLPSGATLQLKLIPNTRIEVNDKKATAADLKANALVEVEYNTRTMEALEVEASTRAEGKGTVKSVNAAAGTVTILTEDGQEITLKVTDTTRVDIHGLLFGILGVSPGMHIKAEFDLTTGEAWELDLRGERHREGKGEVKAEAKAMGTIAGVDAASGKIALNLDDGGSLEMKVTGDTEIEFNGRAVGLAVLEVGARAKIEYDPESKVASQVEARSKDYVEDKGPSHRLEAEVHGIIETVDTDQQMVTIRLRDGSTKELKLNADTVIRINGINGQFSAEVDLKPGMEAEARYRTETNTALRINTASRGERLFAPAHGEVRGRVKKINTISRQLVLETEDGQSVAVDLDIKTRINKRGQTITLLNINADAEVKIQLRENASGNVAESVEVQQ